MTMSASMKIRSPEELAHTCDKHAIGKCPSGLYTMRVKTLRARDEEIAALCKAEAAKAEATLAAHRQNGEAGQLHGRIAYLEGQASAFRTLATAIAASRGESQSESRGEG